MNFDFDLFVIGAGSGGVRAARISAQLGAKVAIAEEYRIGGTCVIRGCVPKKFLVYAAEFAHEMGVIAPSYGWEIGAPKLDWLKLRNSIQDEVSRLSAIYARNLNNSGVTIFESRAIIKDKNTISLSGGREFKVKNILIATGGAPSIPNEIRGAEFAISSNEVFHLEELPKTIIINGGGYIAVEFAHIFAGLGVETILVYRRDTVLRGFDDDIRLEVHEGLKRRGIRVICNTNIIKIDDGERKRVHLTDNEHIDCDAVLLALGRDPYISGLGLENIGVEIENGAIKVDEYSRTNIENIYAVGDVTNRINLTPVAIREGAAFAQTVFGNNPIKMDYENVASAIFSQPPAASVGLSEHDAREKYGDIDIYKTRFRPMRIALSKDETKVMMKIVVRAKDDVVLGVHMVGDDAGEIIQAVAIAVKHGLTKRQFDETCAVHPTIAEELVTLKDKFISK